MFFSWNHCCVCLGQMLAGRYARWTIELKMAKRQLQNGVTAISCCEQNSMPTDDTFLGCSLCKRRYSEPKILPCLHSFCRHCLDAYTPPHSLSVMCPTCRQQSIVPPEGVSGLQDSGFVLRLMEFVGRCQKCSECIGSLPATCASHSSADEQDLLIIPLVSHSLFSRLQFLVTMTYILGCDFIIVCWLKLKFYLCFLIIKSFTNESFWWTWSNVVNGLIKQN